MIQVLLDTVASRRPLARRTWMVEAGGAAAMPEMKGTISPSMPDKAKASRISAKPETPVWWVMRMARTALRNSGQLCSAAWFKVRDPWLPPVISRWSTGPRGLGWMRKNSSRTGSPVASVRPRGKKEGSAAQDGGEDGRSGDVSAHAEDGGSTADAAIARDGGDGQASERGEGLAHAHAVEPADLDILQAEPRGGDEFGFDAMLGADKGDVVAARAQFASHGQRWDDVPARAAAGHQKSSLLHLESRKPLPDGRGSD